MVKAALSPLQTNTTRYLPLLFSGSSYFVSAKSCASRNQSNSSSSICPISDIIMWCVQRPRIRCHSQRYRGDSSRCERLNDTIINTSGQPFIRRRDTKANPYRALKVICDCCTFNIVSGHSARSLSHNISYRGSASGMGLKNINSSAVILSTPFDPGHGSKCKGKVKAQSLDLCVRLNLYQSGRLLMRAAIAGPVKPPILKT